MHKHKIIISLLMLVGASTLQSDIYDVLRGTQNSSNLGYNDLQNASATDIALAQQQASASQAAAEQTEFKPTTLREEAFKELVNKTFP